MVTIEYFFHDIFSEYTEKSLKFTFAYNDLKFFPQQY